MKNVGLKKKAYEMHALDNKKAKEALKGNQKDKHILL